VQAIRVIAVTLSRCLCSPHDRFTLIVPDSDPVDTTPAHREGDAAFLEHSRALAVQESIAARGNCTLTLMDRPAPSPTSDGRTRPGRGNQQFGTKDFENGTILSEIPWFLPAYSDISTTGKKELWRRE
jgi:hypothetical protein